DLVLGRPVLSYDLHREHVARAESRALRRRRQVHAGVVHPRAASAQEERHAQENDVSFEYGSKHWGSEEPPHAQVDLVAVELQVVAGDGATLIERIDLVLELAVVAEGRIDADGPGDAIFQERRRIDAVFFRRRRLHVAVFEERGRPRDMAQAALYREHEAL